MSRVSASTCALTAVGPGSYWFGRKAAWTTSSYQQRGHSYQASHRRPPSDRGQLRSRAPPAIRVGPAVATTSGGTRHHVPVGPSDALNDLVDRLHGSDQPDFDLIADIGCGDLENLVRGHGDELWPDIERLARADPIFRRALRFVWAYDSPEFARRDQLLRELGEHWPVTVRFVAQPEDFLPDARVSWRAVEIDGEPAAGQLARVLREIADWYEHERHQTESPHVEGVGQRPCGVSSTNGARRPGVFSERGIGSTWLVTPTRSPPPWKPWTKPVPANRRVGAPSCRPSAMAHRPLHSGRAHRTGCAEVVRHGYSASMVCVTRGLAFTQA